MEIKRIEELARVMKENGLTALEIQEEGNHVKLERKPEELTVPAFVPAVPAASAGIPGTETAQAPAPAPEGTIVASPTVGVFYTSPSPDSKPFVEVGDRVKKGDTLCIIEAMKLMNEIPAETDGIVAEICAGNGQVVEYNQPLFRIV